MVTSGSSAAHVDTPSEAPVLKVEINSEYTPRLSCWTRLVKSQRGITVFKLAFVELVLLPNKLDRYMGQGRAVYKMTTLV